MVWKETGLHQSTPEHIAAWNPTRVLADIATRRAILAEHEHALVDDPDEPYNFGCNTCHYNAGDYVLRGFGWCKTVRLLAASYVSHENFSAAWAVA